MCSLHKFDLSDGRVAREALSSGVPKYQIDWNCSRKGERLLGNCPRGSDTKKQDKVS